MKTIVLNLALTRHVPDIHIGRTVLLLKLRDFQDLGRKVVFIVGDETGRIGDTSDKNEARPMLDSRSKLTEILQLSEPSGNNSGSRKKNYRNSLDFSAC